MWENRDVFPFQNLNNFEFRKLFESKYAIQKTSAVNYDFIQDKTYCSPDQFHNLCYKQWFSYDACKHTQSYEKL